MSHIPLQGKDDFEHFRVTTEVDFFGDSPVNYALTAVAQEVAELLKQTYPVLANGINHTGTIAIRTLKPEYRQIISTDSLTKRELEVLQLTADGYSNAAIARRLYITVGTVKTHVRNILSKLYVNGHAKREPKTMHSQSRDSAPVLSNER